jgi:thiosulfate dehydrogenase
MPFGANYKAAQLTNEEAWDVAAFVSSQPRPKKFFSYDWPNIASKPVDFPFGPYTDTFTEKQHKYGPFGAIAKAKELKH